MANVPKKPKPNAKQQIPADLQRSIEQQTADFLKGGGQIKQIATGTSGYPSMTAPGGKGWQAKPSAHVVLGTEHERLLEGRED